MAHCPSAHALRRRRLGACAGALVLICAWMSLTPAAAPQRRKAVPVRGVSLAQLREWDRRVDSLEREGDLRVRQRRPDTLVAGRTHERLDQYHRGVRVFGADIARQLHGGQVVSLFGELYEGIQADPAAAMLDADAARAIVEARAGIELGPARQPELVILPLDAGGEVLAWRLRAASGSDVRQYFVDARTGAIVREYSDVKHQGLAGRAVGVLGDTKKISVISTAGRFLARDALRPPSITTYDLAGDFARVIRIANGVVAPGINDIASDTDNAWTDGAASDAHIYAGWTYDYFFKRFNRRGLDNANIAILNIVHPVRREDFSQLADTVPHFFLNAAYYGEGLLVYGVGLPAGVLETGGRVVDFFSGALDVVAHELAHGVTEYSSNLLYFGESGALNEAFSDIMASSVEFFFQPPGEGLMQADYLIAEDVIRPGGIRSLADPAAFDHPDHYSRRYTGPDDNGGVHINSGIANHAFFLAIEGGTNRTSGLPVQGVGSGNRVQIERIFYRAFTQMLPSTATFATARSATIQAAHDLYGADSAAARAIVQAWTAVGVE